nr:OmpA family protein [Gammaproteobacteria bacterium]
LRRAESVRRYLENKGINRARMSVRGFGETRPIAMNDTAEGRASNRRVDIRVN